MYRKLRKTVVELNYIIKISINGAEVHCKYTEKTIKIDNTDHR